MLAALLSNVLMLAGGLFAMVVYDRVIPHQATLTLVVGERHPLAGQSAIDLDALSAESLILLSEEFATREQIDRYREAFAEAGHDWTPRVSVSRSIFPIVDEADQMWLQLRRAEGSDQIGVIDGFRSTFGRSYIDTPDRLVEQLKEDAAVMAADTLMLTIPSQLGPEANLRILANFAEHVAPALGWKPNTEGPVTGYPLA